MKRKIDVENIQTVGEAIRFLQSTDLFCEFGKKQAIKFFAKFKRKTLIDNIDNIPLGWIIDFCKQIRGKTIERFRNRMIVSEPIAYLWAFELRGDEVDYMLNIVNDEYWKKALTVLKNEALKNSDE